MNWQPVARHEIAMLRNTRAVKYLLGLLTITVLLFAYVYPVVGTEPFNTARFTGFVGNSLSGLLALIGVLIGYGAVAGDRESGALRLSLSLPRSRLDLTLGTFLGRVSVLAVVITGAMAGAGFLVIYPFGQFVPGPFIAFVGLMILYAAIWVGVGLTASLAVTTKRRAFILGVGLFLVLVIAWRPAANVIDAGLTRAGLISGGLPPVLRALFGLSPSVAVEQVITALDPKATAESLSILGAEASLIVLILWTVLPLGLGHLRFTRSDLS